MFVNASTGLLVSISGTDPRVGEWEHRAFVPHPLGPDGPPLSPETYLRVADARAALAALDATARQLPNPRLLRRPSLRREAQSTSALEGTYEALREVLTADDEQPVSVTMREVLNFVRMADLAFDWVEHDQLGRALTVGMVASLQGVLVAGTPGEGRGAGQVRDSQVVIGQRPGARIDEAPIKNARFVPSPPGVDLRARFQDLLTWMGQSHRGRIDPVIAAAMGHYQFESLHPFQDGNGRIGRLLIVIQLYLDGTLSEPTLTVSPWFEARRHEYYDRLLEVSCAGDWDSWVSFFARGLEESANVTQRQMLALVAVQADLKERVRSSKLRADTAHTLIDYAVGHPSFSVRQVQRDLTISFSRANKLIADLVALDILQRSSTEQNYNRRFFAPAVLDVLLEASPR